MRFNAWLSKALLRPPSSLLHPHIHPLIMKQILFPLCLFALLLTGCAGQFKAPATQEVANPLTYTDIPDNDVIRVGDTYYMVSTTMYFCPGAPIMESKDLVHWRIINYIYDTLADDDTYNLRNGRNAYGRGQWATTLREHDGVFYALFIANDQRKTFVYSTEDIAKGNWKRHAVYDRPFHDAGLLFDDGRAYVVWGNGELHITELEPDLSAIRAGGVDQVLVNIPRRGGLGAEGAHIYHIGDWYYILVIDWPAGKPRTEGCWRSQTLLGKYEGRDVLQGTIGGRGDGVAQGAIVDTPEGDWWAIQFQDHGAVGRIPTLQPVTWEEGWPVMGNAGLPLDTLTLPIRADKEGEYVWASDEFNLTPAHKGDTPQPFLTDDKAFLSPVWQWNHMPVEGAWSLTERQGWLRLHTATVTSDLTQARGTLTQRTVGPRSISEVLIDASGMKPGDRAGLCAFQSNYATVGVEVDSAGNRMAVIDIRRPGDRWQPKEEIRRVLSMEMPGQELYAHIRYIFTPDTASGDVREEADKAYLAISFDGTTWTQAPYCLEMRYTLDFFTGYRSALYCYSTSETGGYADFDYFHQWIY